MDPAPATDAAAPPPVELALAELSVVADGAGPAGGPTIAPGGIVFGRAGQRSLPARPPGVDREREEAVRELEEQYWLRLDDQGRGVGEPALLGRFRVSRSGLSRREDHYLLAAAGSAVLLLELDSDGTEIRRLEVERTRSADEVSTAAIGSQVLVAWHDTDAGMSFGSWVNLDTWSAEPRFELRDSDDQASRRPVVAGGREEAWIAWTGWTTFASSEVVTFGPNPPCIHTYRLMPGDTLPTGRRDPMPSLMPDQPWRGTCETLGWAEFDGPSWQTSFVAACGAMDSSVHEAGAARTTDVRARSGEDDWSVRISTPHGSREVEVVASRSFRSGAVASAGPRAVIVLEDAPRILAWVVSSDLAVEGEPLVLSEEGSVNSTPSAASDGSMVWVAWLRQGETDQPADVVVRVGRWAEM